MVRKTLRQEVTQKTAFKNRDRKRLISDELVSTSWGEMKGDLLKHFTNTMQGRKKRGTLCKYSFELC